LALPWTFLKTGSTAVAFITFPEQIVSLLSRALLFLHITFNFKLAGHKQLLRIGFARNKLAKVIVRERKSDCQSQASARLNLDALFSY